MAHIRENDSNLLEAIPMHKVLLQAENLKRGLDPSALKNVDHAQFLALKQEIEKAKAQINKN